jgi:hypothetical protein
MLARRIRPHGAHRQPKLDTPAQTARLMALIDDGASPASIAILLRRSVAVIRAKARNLGKPFPVIISRS